MKRNGKVVNLGRWKCRSLVDRCSYITPPRFKGFRAIPNVFMREKWQPASWPTAIRSSPSLIFHSHVSPFSFARAYSFFFLYKYMRTRNPYVQKRNNDIILKYDIIWNNITTSFILLFCIDKIKKVLFCKYFKTYIFVYFPSGLQTFYWFGK